MKRSFTRVKNLDTKVEGLIEEWLSKQFTVNYDNGTFGYLFYEDEGVTWEALNVKKRSSFDRIVFNEVSKANPKPYIHQWAPVQVNAPQLGQVNMEQAEAQVAAMAAQAAMAMEQELYDEELYDPETDALFEEIE